MSQNQRQHITAQQGVGNDYKRAAQTNQPKAQRQHRLSLTARVEPLIDETQREDDLSRCAHSDQPHRQVAMCKEVRTRRIPIREQPHHACNRYRDNDPLQRQPKSFPRVVCVEVPDIDIICNQLPDDNREVVAQPAIETEYARRDHTDLPEDRGREHLLGTFAHNPLHEESRRE